MKYVNNTNYQVTAPNYVSWKLADKYDSLKDAVIGGKEMNKREIEKGFNPSKWIVVKETWSRVFDDAGEFVTESTGIVRMDIDAYL